MYAHRPYDVRAALSTYVESLTPPTVCVGRVGVDAFRQAQEPIAADLAPDQAIVGHLVFHVDIRSIEEAGESGAYAAAWQMARLPVTVWYLYLIGTLGTQARVKSADYALEAGRFLFRSLARDVESLIAESSFIAGPGVLARVQPVATDLWLGEVHFTLLLPLSLEA